MTKPEWQDAKSSMKFSFRFVEEKSVDGIMFGRLEVMWPNGTTGAYLDVNQRTYDDFVSSESRGKFLNRVIKPGFTYVRGEDEKKAAEEAPSPETA
jgi:hypothetical protein